MSSIKEVPVGQLKVRTDYQRPLDEARVARMAKNFNKDLVGVLEISDDGSYWVVDGQHRLAVMRALGIPTAKVLIHHGLTLPEEASLFARLNTERRAVTPMALFKAEVIAGTQRSVEVQEIAARYGLAVNQWTAKNTIQAVAALWNAHRRGTLDQTLSIITEAWPDPSGGVIDGGLDGQMITAIGLFLHQYQDQPEFDLSRLRLVLSRRLPDELFRDARAYSSWSIGRDAVLRDWYNYRLPMAKQLTRG